MTTATSGPCAAWTPLWCCDLTAFSPAATGNALMAATEVLYDLSGQRYGLCEFTVRPCRHECSSEGGWPGFGGWWQWGAAVPYPRPLLFDGVWSNITCGVCGDRCSCTGISEAWLPGPVGQVLTVKLNGSVLVSGSDYRVDDFRKLVRLGGDVWPVCQDMTLADDQPNTWSVTFTVGETVPAIGQFAVAELACSIMGGCASHCALPSNASQVTRQGISIEIATFSEMLANGVLGLRFVDLFLFAKNPHKLRSRPRVYDVDGPSFRRVGTA